MTGRTFPAKTSASVRFGRYAHSLRLAQIGPVAQDGALCLLRGQRRVGPVRDHAPLLLRKGGVVGGEGCIEPHV